MCIRDRVCNTQNEIMESTIANIFWVKNGVIYTPPLASGCIAGVMRQRIIGLFTITEKPLTESELLDAEEVFLSNSIRKVRWIGTFGTISYTNECAKHVHKELLNT